MASSAGGAPSMAMVVLLSMAFVLLGGVVKVSEGAVYKVGDSVGWTIMGSPNYTAWALSKTFLVGDTILFQYNKQFHNVLEVSKSDYNSCKFTSPLASYTTGNDSITIKKKGDYFYLCSFPGHCGAGQKVEILLSDHAASPSPAPATSTQPPPPPPPPPSAPAPESSGGGCMGLGGVVVVLATSVVASALFTASGGVL